MNVPGRVTLIAGEDENGTPVVSLQFPDVEILVDPSMVSYTDGQLHVTVPATVDLPLDVVVIDKWLPATREEAAFAVANVDPICVERILMREQRENPGVPWGRLARSAVALACAGETGAPDAD
jgi:hypothetical protein